MVKDDSFKMIKTETEDLKDVTHLWREEGNKMYIVSEEDAAGNKKDEL